MKANRAYRPDRDARGASAPRCSPIPGESTTSMWVDTLDSGEVDALL